MVDSDKIAGIIPSEIEPVKFQWNENDMSTIGVQAQEIGTIDLGEPVINIGSNNWTSIGAVVNSQPFTISSISSNSNMSYSGSTEYGKNYIKTEKHQIDLDELAEMMETLKKRLLILVPNFEMHEKYPMLKALYDEYKAMERLLSGPDTDE